MSLSEKISFPGHDGSQLAARFDHPPGIARGYALFAHCFSCSKDSLAASRISRQLVANGIAVLRFDFTGLGSSEGEFANTNFSSNVEDLVAAANWLTDEHGRVDMLIGHSLGGAAVIVAATRLPDVKAVITIGAPSDASHVLNQFAPHLETIESEGHAVVELDQRPFTIRKQFVDDVKDANVREAATKLKRPLLILHSPVDATVSIDNATELFISARHPKSFVSLDHANHLLSRKDDAEHAADTIAGWVSRYLVPHVAAKPTAEDVPRETVRVTETGEGGYANFAQTGDHIVRIDEPVSLGGLDSGPTPVELLNAALAGCTSITLRMYLNRKGWPVQSIQVEVSHSKSGEKDATGWNTSIFERTLKVEGDLTPEQRSKLIDIANKCPVHSVLSHSSKIETRLSDAP